ncbi:PE family protein [Mycobacterium sp.]|uniref:PE family protein n=1 Tax=Mycobacterium sp. TaxID=1785 RepID=UPI0025E602AF|nr:PE family protein [Mycobacterium sp.]
MIAGPEDIAAAAKELTSIGSAIRAAHATAAGSTTQVMAAARDEVSTAIAAVFGDYAQRYQTVAGQAAAVHDQFTCALTAGANSYVATEAANAKLAAGAAANPAGGIRPLLIAKLESRSDQELGALYDRLRTLYPKVPPKEELLRYFTPQEIERLGLVPKRGVMRKLGPWEPLIPVGPSSPRIPWQRL